MDRSSPALHAPDLRAVAHALRNRPELAIVLAGADEPGAEQASALDELLAQADWLGAFNDLSPYGRVEFASQPHRDGLRLIASFRPTAQRTLTHTGEPLFFRDLVRPVRRGGPEDAVTRLVLILTRVRRALGDLGALPAAEPKDVRVVAQHLAAWLGTCEQAGLDAEEVIAAAWNAYRPPRGPLGLALPEAPFSLLSQIFEVLDREPEFSTDEIAEIGELVQDAGWPLHDPYICQVPSCPHHHHADEEPAVPAAE